jgi:ferredoxin
MKLKLDKKDLRPFLEVLMADADLYGPVELAEGVSVYKKIDRPEEIGLGILNPQKPAKDIFFPQSEVMFRYEKAGKQTRVTSTEEIKRGRVLFGARPCDIEAVSVIEKVFLGKEYTDVYFLEKRMKTTIIGVGCNQPLSTCFCTSTGGGPFLRTGSDLFFIDLGEAYLVEILSERGKAFRENRFLKEADSKDLALAREIEEKASQKISASVPIEGIDKRLDVMAESSFWDRVHEKCIGCGVCTFLCPTCHCFDIQDDALTGRGERVRSWDSCLFPLYSLETSGHNPRPSGRERTRQRIMHKFNYYPKNFGRVACVGCGRCILYCPVQFDIRQSLIYASARRPKQPKGERI